MYSMEAAKCIIFCSLPYRQSSTMSDELLLHELIRITSIFQPIATIVIPPHPRPRAPIVGDNPITHLTGTSWRNERHKECCGWETTPSGMKS
jgi:hypothetical protein